MTKFESKITPLTNGEVVNKPKNFRFEIGDYLMYDKEKIFIIIGIMQKNIIFNGMLKK